ARRQYRLGEDGGRAVLFHQPQLRVQTGVDGGQDVEAGTERHRTAGVIRVDDGWGVLGAGADVDLQRGIAAPTRHPDAPDRSAAGGVPRQPDLAQHVDRELDDLHVHDDHLFPAHRVGEVDDLRVALGQLLDAGLVAVAEI